MILYVSVFVYFFCLYKFVYHLYRLFRVYASEVRSSLSVRQHEWKWFFALLSFGPFYNISTNCERHSLLQCGIINFGLTRTLRTPAEWSEHTHATTTRSRPKRTKEHKRETKTRDRESACAGDEGATKEDRASKADNGK